MLCPFFERIINLFNIRTSFEKQMDAMGPIASRGVSIPEFLKKFIAICDFPGGGEWVQTPCPPLGPPMEVDANFSLSVSSLTHFVKIKNKKLYILSITVTLYDRTQICMFCLYQTYGSGEINK